MIIYVSLDGSVFCDKLIYIYMYFFLIPHQCVHFEIIQSIIQRVDVFTANFFFSRSKKERRQEGKKLEFIDTSRINKSTDIIIRYNYKVREEKLYPFLLIVLF